MCRWSEVDSGESSLRDPDGFTDYYAEPTVLITAELFLSADVKLDF